MFTMHPIDRAQQMKQAPYRINPNRNHSKGITMKTTISALILATTASAFGIAHAAPTAPATQAYVWTAGETGLVANPAYKAMGNADRTQGLYIVGVGENGLKQNPEFAKLPASMNKAQFKAGVGEVSLIELPAEAVMKVAAK
jgi:hypothetical protein